MRYSVFEKNLITQLESKIRDVTPGLMVRAYVNGKVFCDVAVGDTYAYYDLASLTKIIFTVQAFMAAFEEGRWSLDTKVQSLVPWFNSETVTIRDVLIHRSGLPWWLPFYQWCDLNKTPAERREQLKEILIKTPLEAKDQSVYSDVGFWLLSYVLEAIYDQPIDQVWQSLKTRFYDGTTLEFNQNNEPMYRQSLYAPTEECAWRKRVLQGEVHDENAWSMGGLSTHAGLFGSIDDVSWYALQVRSQLLGIARYHIKQKTAKVFAARQVPESVGDWALGFMMPTLGSASSGSYFSGQSIGHTGFTGTSFWYDPRTDLIVVILSNRVAYGRDNKAFAMLRPILHNWIVEGMKKSSML